MCLPHSSAILAPAGSHEPHHDVSLQGWSSMSTNTTGGQLSYCWPHRGHPGRVCWAEQDLGGSHVQPLPLLHPLPAVDGLPGICQSHRTHQGGAAPGSKHPPRLLGQGHTWNTPTCLSLKGKSGLQWENIWQKVLTGIGGNGQSPFSEFDGGSAGVQVNNTGQVNATLVSSVACLQHNCE